MSGDGGRWRSGESTRLLPIRPGFDSRPWHHMWVEFVVGFRPYSEGLFSRSSTLSMIKKRKTKVKANTQTKKQKTGNQMTTRK